MNRNVTLYNHLVRKYYQCKRRLANLQQANRNHRRQGILAKHIERLYRKLTALKARVRLATASTAIAVSTIGFAPQAVQAQTFGPVQTNPFGLANIGDNYTSPAFADLDNDGDFDLLTGMRYGSFTYFENIGTNSSPSFTTGVTNPFGLTYIGGESAPVFVDLDDDGDFDILAGQGSGAHTYKFFENTGNASSPAFGAVQNNPFGLTNNKYAIPTFADLDNDGDFDLLSGKGGNTGAPNGSLRYFENVGTNLLPSFAAVQTDPFGLADVGSFSAPAFVDLDGDGDFDVMSGEVSSYSSNAFFYFENTGSVISPSFANVQNNPFGLTDIGEFTRPTFIDLDNDGDMDMLAGERNGDFFYFENYTVPPTPNLVITEIMYNPPESFTDSLEFIEIYNNGAEIDLENFTCTGGDYIFPDVTLGAGEFYVLAGDSASFNAAYGFYPNGLFTNGLSNGGEDIVLKTPAGTVVDSVNYGDGGLWPSGSSAGEADGGGASIVLCDIEADNNVGSNWSASTLNTGSIVNSLSVLASPGISNPCFDICNVVAGIYPDASVVAGQNATVIPSVAPSGATVLNAFAETGFAGVLAADPSTGEVTITDALHAGVYDVTVTAPLGCGESSFTLTVTNPECAAEYDTINITVDADPTGTAVGDFNGDGFQDLIVTHFFGQDASVYLGDGVGGFTTNSSFPAGFSPGHIGLGDFNGDGNQDLVISNLNSDDLSIGLGNGDGTFTPSFTLPVGETARAVVVGEFNGDKIQDLAAINRSDNSISIRLGNGIGGFINGSDVPVGIGPQSIAAADFNGDNIQDLVTCNYSSDDVSVRLGDGSGEFTSALDVAVGNTPQSIAVGDFNGDGEMDFVVANGIDADVSVRLGNGSGGFTAVSDVPVGGSPVEIAVGDFNGDGILDFLTANANDNNLSMRLGDGTGGFFAVDDIPVNSGSGSISIGDFDQDGRHDFIVSNSASDNLSIVSGVGISLSGNTEVEIGSSISLTGNGTPASVNPWQSSNTSLATVNASGEVTGVTEGDVDITYTTQSGCSTTQTINVFAPPALVITEIMYNPPESNVDSLEFIEIYNNGSDVELENFTCTGGDYVFPDVTLAAGEFYVIAIDSVSFNAAYGFYPDGVFTNGLSNSGEDIVIKTADGAVVDSVDFSDGGLWPSGSSAGLPDGGGASIVLCDVDDDNNDGNNWSAASADVGITVNGLPLLASPGELNPCSHLCGVLTGTNNTTICFEESIVINGTTYDANNPTGTEVFTGIGEYNCDSTVTVNLNVLPQLTATNNTTICYDGHVEVNGTTYNAANPTGTEVFSNISPDGCDLTVMVNLNVLPELTGTNNTTICHDGSVDINGTTYDAGNPTGTEVFTGIGPNDCDSTVTVNLNVLPELTGTNTTTICNDESVDINGTIYDAGNPTGTEVFTNIGPNGCDSTVSVNLNVLPDIDESVDDTSIPTLSANQSGATYQWIDCDNGNAPISGATDQTYTVTNNGNYAVEVTVNGCTETSPCINVIAIGVSESSELAAGIYPNPSSGLVNISLRESAIGASYKILSAEGKLIRSGMVQSTELRIDLSTEAKGVYTIELSANAARSVHMLILE